MNKPFCLIETGNLAQVNDRGRNWPRIRIAFTY